MKNYSFASWAFGFLFLTFFGCRPTPQPAFFLPLTGEQAFEKARAENKMVFLDFYADWCGPCKVMDKTTWQDARVIQLLTEKTIPVKADVDKNPDLALKYQVEVLPTLLLVKGDGSIVNRLIGYRDGPELAAELEKSLALSTNAAGSFEQK